MAFFRPKTSNTSTTSAEISGGHQGACTPDSQRERPAGRADGAARMEPTARNARRRPSGLPGPLEAKPFATEEEAETFMVEEMGLRSPLE